MNENLKKLLETLDKDPEVKKQVKENPPKTQEELLALAAQLGCALTAEDLAAAKNNVGEKELAAVSAGSKISDIYEKDGLGWAILCVTLMGVGAEW